ncbi:MAG: glycosyltransferase [Agathobacter sp.]|nr:glycosyltransferase [Agathobacter sp.]
MENNNPLISVVIPVYNAEKYLDNLLMDVINQTYQRLEIIVVNDGSIDRSLDIAKRYSQKDDRIKIINVPNGGVSKARNLGIENATGQYIRFVDADDRVPQNSTQYLIEPFQKNQNMDLSIGNFIPVPKAPLFTGATGIEELVDAKELANRFSVCPRTYYYGVLWNKLYRADIINEHNIRFKDQLAWCEDLLFNIEYYILIDKIAFISKEEGVYRYNTRVENSLTDKIDKEKKRYEEIEKERYKLLYFCPLYCSHCLKIKPWRIYGTIIRHIISVVVMIVVFKAVTLVYMPTGWISLISTALVMVVVGALIHVLVMTDKAEKQKIRKKIFKA